MLGTVWPRDSAGVIQEMGRHILDSVVQCQPPWDAQKILGDTHLLPGMLDLQSSFLRQIGLHLQHLLA